MSKIRLYGSTSGYVDLAAPAVADDGTLTLPTAAEGFAKLSGGIGSNVVQAVKTDTFTTTSGSYVDVSGLTVTITPTSNTAKILVLAKTNIQNSGTGNGVHLQVVRDSTAVFIGASAGSRVQSTVSGSHTAATNGMNAAIVAFVDSPQTTSPTTYKLQMRRGGGGTAMVNRTQTDSDNNEFGRSASSIIAIEVAA